MSPFTLTVGSQASLRGASATLAEALKQQLTIDNPEYLEAKKYSRWMGKKLKPQLYFFTEHHDTITFPRGYANHAILLARKFMRQDPQIIDQRRPQPRWISAFWVSCVPTRRRPLPPSPATILARSAHW